MHLYIFSFFKQRAKPLIVSAARRDIEGGTFHCRLEADFVHATGIFWELGSP